MSYRRKELNIYTVMYLSLSLLTPWFSVEGMVTQES